MRAAFLLYGLTFILACSEPPASPDGPSKASLPTANSNAGAGKPNSGTLPETGTKIPPPTSPLPPSGVTNGPGTDAANSNGGTPPGNAPVTASTPPSTLIDGAFLKSFLNDIAGPTTEGRGTGAPQNRAAAALIAGEFEKAGFKPAGDNNTYLQAFKARGIDTQNIIGMLPGKTLPEEIIIIGAHMDHLGVTNGATFFGADDNGTGTSAVVSIARALGKVKDQLNRSVVVMAFSGEEMGLLGSAHFVKNPTIDIKQVKFMLNIDMIGYSNGKVEAFGYTGTLDSNRIIKELFGKTTLIPSYAAATGGGSDHVSFETVNIPTGVLHTGLHQNYHKATDTVEKIDYVNYEKLVRVAADFMWSMARVPKIEKRTLAMEPVVHYGYAPEDLHRGGCEPALASFEEIQNTLDSLKAP